MNTILRGKSTAWILAMFAGLGTLVVLSLSRSGTSTLEVDRQAEGGVDIESDSRITDSLDGLTQSRSPAIRGPAHFQVHRSASISQFKADLALTGLGAWLDSHRLTDGETQSSSGDPLGGSIERNGASVIRIPLMPEDGQRETAGGLSIAQSIEGEPFTVAVIGSDLEPSEPIEVACFYRIRSVEAEAPDQVGLWMDWTELGSATRLPRPTGECLVLVRHASGSAIWFGSPAPSQDVIVELGSGLKLFGSVQISGGTTAYMDGVVSLWSQHLDGMPAIGTCIVDGNGVWSLPEIHGDYPSEAVLRHLSLTCVECEQLIQLPKGGGLQSVQIPCGSAASQDVVVVQSDGEPFVGCGVEVLWVKESGDSWLVRASQTGKDGEVAFNSLPASGAYFRVAQKGFAPTLRGPFSIPLPNGDPLVLHAGRSASLVGTVLLGGAPCSDFEIYWWRSQGDVESRSFRSVGDGRFEVAGIEEGNIWVLARAGVTHMSDVKLAKVTQGKESSVVLRLEQMASMDGMVVSAGTGAPIVGAHVAASIPDRPWVAGEDCWATTNEGGMFYAAPVGATGASLAVWSEGYATVESVLKPSDYKLGYLTIEMVPTLDCGVKLLGVTSDELAQARLVCKGSASPGEILFAASGIARICGVRLAVVSGELLPPWPGVMYFSFSPEDFAGRVAPITLDVGRELRVIVDGAGARQWVELRFVNSEGVRIITARQVDEQSRSAIFTEVSGGDVQVAVVEDGVDVYHSIERVPSAGDWTIDVPGGRGSKSIVLRDSDHNPLSNQQVWAYFLREPATNRTYWTDADGRLAIPDSIAPDAVLVITSKGKSLLWWRRVAGLIDVPSGEVQVAPTVRVQVACTSNSKPLPGVQLDFYHPDVPDSLFRDMSDASGSSSWLGLGSRHARVVLTKSGYWPEEFDFGDNSGEHRVSVDMRQLGGFSLLWGAVPQGAQSVSLKLQDRLTGAWVKDWIDSGLIEGRLDRGGLNSIDFAGLPVGAYEWTLMEDGFQTGGGVVDVSHGESAVLEVVRN